MKSLLILSMFLLSFNCFAQKRSCIKVINSAYDTVVIPLETKVIKIGDKYYRVKIELEEIKPSDNQMIFLNMPHEIYLQNQLNDHMQYIGS